MYAAALDTHPGDEMLAHCDIFDGVEGLGRGQAHVFSIPQGKKYLAGELFSFPRCTESTDLGVGGPPRIGARWLPNWIGVIQEDPVAGFVIIEK